MKIVKKLKGIISWHVYNDDEIRSVLKTVLDFADGVQDTSIPILTNLFKGTDGDDIAEFFIISTQDENRLYIDNEQRKVILNVRFDDIENLINVMEGFMKNKRVPTQEIMKIMIAKKEYVLQGFNQQYKKFLNRPKKDRNNKNEKVSIERHANSVNIQMTDQAKVLQEVKNNVTNENND